MALVTPSPTLYITGLDSKTKKPELKQQLYAYFTPYGKVIDIVAKKHGGGQGQAFVVFAEQSSATTAMRTLSGDEFYDKKISITYSKTPSLATLSINDPTASRDAVAVRAAKLVVSRAQGEYEALEREREAQESGVGSGAGAKRGQEDGEEGGRGKRAKVDGSGGGGGGDDEEMEIEMDEEEDDDETPAKGAEGVKLIATNLPPECTEDIMSALFSQYAGFSKAAPLPSSTPIPSSHGTPNANAKSFFITFSSREQAEAAIGPTKGYLMQPGWEMGVSVE